MVRSMETQFETTGNQTLCPDCFRKTFSNGVCSACGFTRENQKESSMRLPEMLMLQNRYCIGKVLGAGGFGITYKAFDSLNRTYCAVKEYVPSEIVNGREEGTTQLSLRSQAVLEDFEHGKKRFMNEAQLLKQMNYMDSVVHITDYFMENGTAYFVMEYLDGVTVSELKKAYGGRIPCNDALYIIRQTGQVLQEVHSKIRIFHRDISTQNIMVMEDGKVKLIDFGNAKYLTGKETQNLTVILKRGFAPPEQYSSVSRQGSFTDVYALAATFYDMVSGIMIPEAMDRSIYHESYVPLCELGIGISKQISDAVDHALVMEPAKRTQTAAEFLEEMGLTEPQKQIPFLEILTGTEAGRYQMPEHIAVSLGRTRKENGIQLCDSNQISHFHCEVFFDNLQNQFYLEDHSTNGTYIDGRRLKKNEITLLVPGTIVTLGNGIYTFRVGVQR